MFEVHRTGYRKLVMKKYPYPSPQKKLKTVDDVSQYITDLTWNALNWLKMDGYVFFVHTPKMEGFHETKESGMNINVTWPYKKFNISIQQNSIDSCLKSNPGDPFWDNMEDSVFHEVFHVVLWRIDAIADKRYTTPIEMSDANEYTVDHLTHCFMPLIRDLRKHEKEKSHNKKNS